MRNPHAKKSYLGLVPRSYRLICSLLLAASTWLVSGCGPLPEDERPCTEAGDCLAQETCTNGFCRSLSTTPTQPKTDAPMQPKTDAGDALDASTAQDIGPKETRSKAEYVATNDDEHTLQDGASRVGNDSSHPSSPDTPKRPLCPAPAPRCLAQGVCQGVRPTCEAGVWRCQYPPDYQAQETNCDGKDNDCDGLIDEGISRACYSGAPGTQGRGPCKEGVQICERGKWGPCGGEISPQTEICDDIDNDCDGQIDNGLEKTCYDGPVGSQGKGLCKAGVQRCDGGRWTACMGQVTPSAEICDNQDNDCDGQIDEGVSRSCYDGPAGSQGKGLCQAGTQTCQAGAWGACVGQVKPVVEACDNQDNDCDGQVDEALTRSCYSGPFGTAGRGLCRSGMQTCQAGRWGSCIGEVKPVAEVCDNQDNDCDGQVDESLTRSCYSGPFGTAGRGLCRSGTQTCGAGRWGACVGQVLPADEVCDGKDNDCDGRVDEGSRICGTRKICANAQCVCDQKSGYYPSGQGCVKDGERCPSGLRQRPYCATNSHWVMCDPFGYVGIVHCPSFSGTQCVSIGSAQGCQAIPSQHLKRSCMSFTTNYGTPRTWHAVMMGLGPSPNQAVITFDHCIGNGRSFCGYIATAQGSQASCMCGERRTYCAKLGGYVYDVSYATSTGQCHDFWGSTFGCPAPLAFSNGCGKTTVNGFATYSCGF